MELCTNTTATAELIVGPEDLASAIALGEDDNFPAVFATARMVALMEVAAARAMHNIIRPDELSVGVVVNISHTAATAVADTVIAQATFTCMEGKLYVFNVSARDSGGEIGSGTHKRAIVTTERLLSGIEKRKGTK
ncbi:MAG: thioesterase family protein [Rickettsiales bacterium]